MERFESATPRTPLSKDIATAYTFKSLSQKLQQALRTSPGEDLHLYPAAIIDDFPALRQLEEQVDRGWLLHLPTPILRTAVRFHTNLTKFQRAGLKEYLDFKYHNYHPEP